MATSTHYSNDRLTREELISQIGIGKTVTMFKWDRGHRNGPEVHKITTTGIIVIYNYNTKKMITKLIARPGQLERYFGKGKVPEDLMKIAIEHSRWGFNRV